MIAAFFGLGVLGWCLFWLVSEVWTCQPWVGVVFVGFCALATASAALPLAPLGFFVGLIFGGLLWDAWCT